MDLNPSRTQDRHRFQPVKAPRARTVLDAHNHLSLKHNLP
jgi:hypothetical protein